MTPARLVLTCVLLGSSACATARPALPHLRQVRPNVWASGQPSEAGFREFAAHVDGRSVTVVKLNFASEGSDKPARILGWRVLELGISPRTDYDGLVQAIEEVTESPDPEVWAQIVAEISQIPVVDDGKRAWLIHCVNGNDRTNLTVGHVRVLVDRWTKERAFREMVEQGFHWELIGLDRQWIHLQEEPR
jgi:hypothetical protein